MAKVSFNKLDLKKNQKVVTLKYNDIETSNTQEIRNVKDKINSDKVRQYLPIEEKLELISKVISNSADENNFYNAPKGHVFTTLGIVEYYTNINFTEKQLEDPQKLYDLIVGNGLDILILNAIPEKEIMFIESNIEKIAKGYYDYRHSALGIIETISQDYNNLNFDTSELQKNIADPNNLELLRSILSKLG